MDVFCFRIEICMLFVVCCLLNLVFGYLGLFGQ